MMEGEREKTVILTTVNQAWAANNSLLDLFVESFRIGDNTERLLNHLVVITLDQHAYDRCISVHPHHRNCYLLHTKKMDFSKEAFFMSHDYLEMMWRRIDFLRSILDLGYSFIFTVCILTLTLQSHHCHEPSCILTSLNICFIFSFS